MNLSDQTYKALEKDVQKYAEKIAEDGDLAYCAHRNTKEGKYITPEVGVQEILFTWEQWKRVKKISRAIQMPNFSMKSPESGNNWSLEYALNKFILRGKTVGYILFTKVAEHGKGRGIIDYGDKDYLASLNIQTESQTTDSLSVKFEGRIPVHVDYAGKLSIGFNTYMRRYNNPDNIFWNENMKRIEDELHTKVSIYDSTQSINSETITLNKQIRELLADKLLEIIKEMMSRAQFNDDIEVWKQDSFTVYTSSDEVNEEE